MGWLKIVKGNYALPVQLLLGNVYMNSQISGNLIKKGGSSPNGFSGWMFRETGPN